MTAKILGGFGAARARKSAEVVVDVDEWREELNLLGPFADETALQNLIERAPPGVEDDVALVRQWLTSTKVGDGGECVVCC